MEKLQAKLKKQGGFTLVEMLIVVAIIAILIAVSIPMVSGALERSRHAVDQANVRDAISLASIYQLTYDTDADTEFTYHVTKNHQGFLKVKDNTEYNKDLVGDPCIAQCTCGSADKDHVLKVKIGSDGMAKVNWTFDSDGKTTTKDPTQTGSWS